MKVNVEKFLKDAGVSEPFYPGKRMVLPCQQTGEFKGHCVVLDWRVSDKIVVEVKPGLSGKTLAPERIKQYPVSFQLPTYVNIEIVNDNEEEEEEGSSGARGKSGGGGGKKPAKTLSGLREMANAFGEVVEGKIPSLGKITGMVVMGTQIAEQAFGKVFETLTNQIAHAKITATELLAQAGDFVTRYTPPSFLEPKGNEQANYKYDREKNADIGFSRSLG